MESWHYLKATESREMLFKYYINLLCLSELTRSNLKRVTVSFISSNWHSLNIITMKEADFHEVKVVKNGSSKSFGRQPLKNLKWHGSSQIFVPQTWSILEYFEPFYTTDLFLYPLKTTKSHRNQFHEMSQSQTLEPSKPLRNHEKTIPGNQSDYSFTNNTTLFPRHFHDQYETKQRN